MKSFLAGLLTAAQTLLSAAAGPIAFDRISTDQGLSQSTVTAICRDARGFMWFGTYDGLNRYDGYRFRVFKHDPNNPASISQSNITDIYEDRAGNLWIGTLGGGLNRFDRKTEEFHAYRPVPGDSASLSSDYIRQVFEDREGNLWIATWGGGLNRMKPGGDGFIRYRHDPADPGSLLDDRIAGLCEDLSGDLWLATATGVCRLDRRKNRFIRYRHNPSDPASLAHDDVAAIAADLRGNIWIGTWGGGLDRFDAQNNRFIHHRHDPNDHAGLSHDIMRTLYIDPHGRLWVGTWGGGLDLYEEKENRFVHFRNNPTDPASLSGDFVYSVYLDPTEILWVGSDFMGLNKSDLGMRRFRHHRNDRTANSLNNNTVMAVCEDRSGILWIGTKGGGLNRFDRKKNKFTFFMHDPRNPNSLSDNVVRGLAVDSAGVLWVATEVGLNRLDEKTGRFTRYLPDPNDPASLSYHNVWQLFVDRRGVLWAGTYAGGLNRYDRNTDRFIRYLHDPKDPSSIGDDFIWSFSADREGRLWIGTDGGGLNRLDEKTGRFIRYRSDPADPASLSADKVLCLHRDRSGTLWAGTTTGLNRYDPENDSFSRYGVEHGLPSNAVHGIEEDDHGNLWIATSRGLARFDPRAESFKNYSASAGLQSDEFSVNACRRLSNGELFFGGINGFNLFHPDSIRDNPFIPPVVITDLQIFNRPVPVGDIPGRRSVLDESISEAHSLTLSWTDRVISFEFAALSFSAPEQNRYAYRMEGFETAWNRVKGRHFATYTNLPPGGYVFRVRGSNPDGVWNEEGVSLAVRITPPFWKTGLFRAFLGILLAAVLIGITLRIIHVIKHGKRALAYERNLMRILMETIPDHIYFKDRQSRFLRINRSHAERFGLQAPEEAVGKTDFDFFSQEHARQAFEDEQAIIRTGKPVMNVEEKETWPDRPDTWVSTTKMPIRNEKGEIVGTFGISRDVTNRKLARMKLEQTTQELRDLTEKLKRSNEELEQFAYIASHDLLEPLRMVSSYATLIERKIADRLDADTRDFFDFMTDGVKRMQILINDLLTYSRVTTQAGEFKTTPLDEPLDRALRNLEITVRERGARITRDPLPAVKADAVQMERLFQNLIGNAVKYCEKTPEIHVTAEKAKREWIIGIRDNGIGIDPKYRDRIFGIFQRLHRRDEYSGTGIGLAVCKKIMDRHGGRIRVESEGEGKGSTFQFTLPV
mgnify:CR=1 FL=1